MMNLKKIILGFIIVAISMVSFANVTFYNKSADILTIGYKICSYTPDILYNPKLVCPESIIKLPPIGKNQTYTFPVSLGSYDQLVVYTVNAITPQSNSFTEVFPTFEMYGQSITNCIGGGIYGLLFTAFNDQKEITCTITTGGSSSK